MDNMELNKAKEARKRYYKEWRAKNRDKVREINLRYWARRAERENAERAQDQEETAKHDE